MPTPEENAQWAAYNLDEFDKCQKLWYASMQKRRPNFNALIGMYRHMYGAEINFHDAGDEASAREAETVRKDLSSLLETIMTRCNPDEIFRIYKQWYNIE